MSCVFCFKQINDNVLVRTLSPKDGKLHPQTHITPHGVGIDNEPVYNACADGHGEMEHIHDSCVPSWCDKFNMPVPEPFEPGDWNRLYLEAFDN